MYHSLHMRRALSIFSSVYTEIYAFRSVDSYHKHKTERARHCVDLYLHGHHPFYSRQTSELCEDSGRKLEGHYSENYFLESLRVKRLSGDSLMLK